MFRSPRQLRIEWRPTVAVVCRSGDRHTAVGLRLCRAGNLLDSSAWLECFSDGPSADEFAEGVEAPDSLLVPTIVLYEVTKVVRREKGEDELALVTAALQKGVIADLTASLALVAARISHELQFPLADSIILATARAHNATLWTHDAHFEELPEAHYVPKHRCPAGAVEGVAEVDAEAATHAGR